VFDDTVSVAEKLPALAVVFGRKLSVCAPWSIETSNQDGLPETSSVPTDAPPLVPTVMFCAAGSEPPVCAAKFALDDESVSDCRDLTVKPTDRLEEALPATDDPTVRVAE
jgi:hypothetical protein